MKIIPLLLLLGATPVLAQGTTPAPTPAATPAKASKAKSRTKAKAGETTKAEEKTAEKAEGEKQSRRHRRVSRRPARAPRPVIVHETEVAAKKEEKKQEEKKPQKAASAKPAPAQATKARTVKTAKADPNAKTAAPDAVEEGAEKKKRGGPFSFIGRIFGGGKKAEQPAEEKTVMVGPPAPTPAPAPRQPRGRVSASPQDSEPAEYEAPLPSYQRQPQAPPVAVHRTVTNARGEMVTLDDDSDLPSSEPYIPQQRSLPPQPRQQPVTSSPAPQTAVASTFDRTRYQETRRKAAEDPDVASLGKKLNATTPGDDAHGPAARAYTIALFGKMRDLDPDQAEWITRMEAATIRRIDAGKPVFAE